MNPDTKLTLKDLRTICERHGIVYTTHQRIAIGFSHEVHRLNNDLVIKLFDKTTLKNYQREKSVFQIEKNSLRKPKLVYYFDGSQYERAYLITKYVAGKPLGGVWHLATNIQRKHLIQEISQTLRAFQSINPDELQLERYKTWGEYLNTKVQNLLQHLLKTEVISVDRAAQVQSAFNKSTQFFSDNEPLSVVYWDIHFDNFIVDEQYNLKAIIDLENVRMLPIDYPLFVVRKQMEQPHKYLAEVVEKYANKRDYIHLWDWYKEYYPELFAFEHLEERILTYQLLDELHLMVDWSDDAELRQSFIQLLTVFNRF